MGEAERGIYRITSENILKMEPVEKKETNGIYYDLLIIGGGPAGTGLLLKALKDGMRNNLFDRRVALVEQSSQLVAGNIIQYRVNSDTLSDVFLECLEGATGDFIDIGALNDEIEFVKMHQGKSIPLTQLDAYFTKLGNLLRVALESAGKCKFFMNTTVNKVVQHEDGTYSVHLLGKQNPIATRQIVLATGGVPKLLLNETFANIISLHCYQDKIIHSDKILKSGLDDDMSSKLKQQRKVVILGGSHSAFSVAHHLLNGVEDMPFNKGDIQIWSTSSPRIYFNTKEDAIASGYDDFGDEDFCPVTGKLYRLAGLRMDGRELYMQMLGLGQSTTEGRVAHHVFVDQKTELENELKAASIIVLAYGYQWNMVPFFDAGGKEIHLWGIKTNCWVNDNCELLEENGRVIPNVFATGMATGFLPKGALGGEPSFEGQTNGIWYYQNAIAELIMRNMGVVTSR